VELYLFSYYWSYCWSNRYSNPFPEPQGPCTNTKEEFKISKVKSTVCKVFLASLKKLKQKKLCKKKAALQACPVIPLGILLARTRRPLNRMARNASAIMSTRMGMPSASFSDLFLTSS